MVTIEENSQVKRDQAKPLASFFFHFFNVLSYMEVIFRGMSLYISIRVIGISNFFEYRRFTGKQMSIFC